jgi:enoyl-CoA hydratase/carnithine racemase
MTGMIDFSVRNNVARLVMNQPRRRNAMTFDMWSTIPQLLARAEADPQVRLVILTGAGTDAFSAGADISEFSEKRSNPADVERYNAAVHRATEALQQTPLPTLALIHGFCFGGGFELALCCDLRFASSDALFRIPAGRLGLGYGYDSIGALVRRLGPGAAAEILFTAGIIDATRAERLNVVQRVFAPEAFADGVDQQISLIVDNAPLTLRAVKTALVELDKPETTRSAAKVDVAVAVCFASQDYAEGQAAFRDKRAPQFRGR